MACDLAPKHLTLSLEPFPLPNIRLYYEVVFLLLSCCCPISHHYLHLTHIVGDGAACVLRDAADASHDQQPTHAHKFQLFERGVLARTRVSATQQGVRVGCPCIMGNAVHAGRRSILKPS